MWHTPQNPSVAQLTIFGSPAQCFRYHLRILSRDFQQRLSWPFWFSPALFPVLQGRNFIQVARFLRPDATNDIQVSSFKMRCHDLRDSPLVADGHGVAIQFQIELRFSSVFQIDRMILVYIFFIVGFPVLLGGAHLLVRGAGSVALKLGMSELAVGLTVVAFGTSAMSLIHLSSLLMHLQTL